MAENLLDEKELHEAINYGIISPSFAERVLELINAYKQAAQHSVQRTCAKSPDKEHHFDAGQSLTICMYCGASR